MEDPPSGGAPEHAPRWDLTGTEGCGGGIRVFSIASMFSGYMGIYRRKEGIGGATWGPQGMCALFRGSQVSREDIAPKISLPKVSFRLDSV